MNVGRQEKPNEKDEKKPGEKEKPKKKKAVAGKEENMQDIFEIAYPKFCNYIKENQRLVHLDLTSANFQKEEYMELIRNLKRSQSLHAVHLCGNI